VTGALSVVVHATTDLLAQAAAARLVTGLVDVQAARGHAHVVLTGGGIGIATLAALASSAARDAVDWRALDVWWGDERFLPAGHRDRNETQAREALLDRVPVPAERVHAMAASDGPWGDDLDAAARGYAEELAAATRTEERRDGVPAFDILMLGVGPDAHVASLFPEGAALHVEDASVVGVRGAPKPPPNRISLTAPAIRCAREVWLLAAGAEKAGAVSLALSGAGQLAVPAAGAVGQRRTLWLLDRAAAARLPASLARIASP
jgi:6-phosphogluconolactonase